MNLNVYNASHIFSENSCSIYWTPKEKFQCHRIHSIVQWVNFVKSIVTHIHFDAYKSQKQSPNVILLTKCKWLNGNIRIAIILLSSFRQLCNVFLCWSNNFMLAFSVVYNRRYTQIRKLCASLSGFSFNENEKCCK